MQGIRLQRMCWLLIGGLTLGLGTQGCLGRSRGWVLFQKVCLQRETNKGRNGQQGIYSRKSVCRRRQRRGRNGRLSPMGPFILALDSFYGLKGNFIICFEAISIYSPLSCFSYLWTSNPMFLGLYQVPPVPRVSIGSPKAITLLTPFAS
jgi:hypothetical protein